ncbi:MAG TPA: hypothetical protein VMZ52_00365, partial [Bryobacteraceae bacterium]|nr:hypothetical protein [Bryobacteraceae bacterium]
NQAVDDDLNTNVPNPFNIKNYPDMQNSNPVLYKYLGTQGFFTSSTIRKHQLLRAFPQMNSFNGLRPGVDFNDSRGSVGYHDLQVQFEKRFSRGFQTAVLYTYANSEKKDYYLNEFDSQLSSRPNDVVLPHRFVWTAIYELPFGKGKQFLQGGVLQHILGGWQASWVYQRQTGPPIDWGNRFFYGDLNNLGNVLNHDAVHERDIHVWFDPNIAYRGTGAVPQGFQGFEGRSANQPGSFQTRVFPVRLDVVRADGIRNWDVKVKRNFHVHERLNTSFAVDLLNATNHTNFDKPNTDPTNNNFGRVTSQRGLSRVIQFNLRVDF